MYRSLITLSVCAALAACHDDDRRIPVATDTTAPQATITFPARDAATTAATFRVSGTAQDNVSVAGVRINGVPATSGDGFAHWSADVPLQEGRQSLTVEVTDAAGNVVAAADAVQVLRRVGIEQPAGGELDATGNQLYYVDTQALAINRIHLDTGVVSRVADISRFAGGALPLDLALDLTRNRILLGVRHASQDGSSTIGVWTFNTQTRAWSVLSDSATGAGPALANPARLELSADGQTLFVAEFTTGIVAVNTTSGNRSVLSSNTVPSTNVALFSEIMDIAIDGPNNRLLVLDRGSDALFAVSLVNGARTAISRTGAQSGPDLNLPLSLALDTANNRALVYEFTAGGVLGVDLASGTRVLVDSQSQLAPDHDDDLGNVDVRALFWRNGRLLLLDNNLDSVLSIDPLTHERERLANNSFPAIRQRAVYGSDSVVVAGVPYFADSELSQVLSLDASNAVRIVAGATVTGSAALDPGDLVTGGPANILYALDTGSDGNGVFPVIRSIHTGTGAISTVLSGTPLGASAEYPHALAVTGSTGYLVTSTGAYRVNMSDGSRVLLSAPAAWSFGGVRQVAIDSARNRLLLAPSTSAFLIAVDLTTGAQTAFSDSAANGPALVSPWGIAVGPGGEIWVSDRDAGLFRVDPASGARTRMSGPGVPDDENQPAYGSTGYKSLQFDGEALYAIDMQGEIVQVDVGSGHRATILSGWTFARNRAPVSGSPN